MANSDTELGRLCEYIVRDVPSAAFHKVTDPLRIALQAVVKDVPVAKGNTPHLERLRGSGLIVRLEDNPLKNSVARIHVDGETESEIYGMECLITMGAENRPEIVQFYDSNVGLGLLRVISYPTLSEDLAKVGLTEDYIRSMRVNEIAKLTKDASEFIFPLLDKHTYPIDGTKNPIQVVKSHRPVRI